VQDIESMFPDDDDSPSLGKAREKAGLNNPQVVEDLFAILNEISQSNSVRELHLETKKNFNKTLFQIGGTLFVAGLVWLISSVVSLNLEVSELKYKVQVLQDLIKK
jgi:hypothetical protein